MKLVNKYQKATRALLGGFVLQGFCCWTGCANSKEGEQVQPVVQSTEVSRRAETRGLNRLAREKSPYLLQHASNPVEWFSWGDEAFEKARREDKPVFLSIGYSTCHWCHVMEHESFEDEEVAALLNESFVSIKVDREERPDIDHIYMTVCQLMTGGGGWPLTLVMTPDKKPFFAATYIPKESRFGRTGMLGLIPKIAEAWQTRRGEILASAGKIVAALKSVSSQPQGDEPGEEALHRGFSELADRFDKVHAGFGKGMKFPTPHQLVFLLRYWRRTGNQGALEMAEKTLQAMRRGGIFDHVGFGFHRYSTDPEWLVPHFEKMLYDQALLLVAYCEAFEATRKLVYAETARELAEYVLRDLTSPVGAFYSAEDADSEGEEGKFYLWTAPELRAVLGDETASLVIDRFGVAADGNFREEATGQYTGRNILHENMSVDEVAARASIPVEKVELRLESARKLLLEARTRRVRPLMDDKVLTDWNGLMIGALSIAGRIFDEPKYVDAARKAAGFIRDNLVNGDGRLLHRFREDEAGLTAHLDDYAFLTFGLIELYEATYEASYLAEAIGLSGTMIDLFSDRNGGGFLMSARDAEKVLVRTKELYDGAIPSGNSVAVYNLARLSRITGEAKYEKQAAAATRSFSDDVAKQASAHALFLVALDFAIGPSVEIVVAGRRGSGDTKKLFGGIGGLYAPNKVVLLRPEADTAEIASLAPYIADQVMLNGKATAYVCVDQSCSFPTNDVETARDLIRERLGQQTSER